MMARGLRTWALLGFVATLVLPAAGAPLFQAAGPVGYWTLDDLVSPSVDSISAANGTWNGAVAASTDVPAAITTPANIIDCGSIRVSPVATAGGVNYVSLGRNATLDNVQTGSFTLSVWFKPASLPPATGNDQQYGILLKTGVHEGISLAGTGYVMGHWTGLIAAPNYHAAGYGTANAAVGTWAHIAGVVDTTVNPNQVRIYVNGVAPPFNAVATYTPEAPLALYANEAWLLGINDPNGGTAEYQADGWIDDARIYNRVLTTTEISTLAAGGKVGDPVVAPPAAPTGLAGTPGVNQVSLTWNPVAGASAYNVKRSTTAGMETQYTIATTNAYVDLAATGGTPYFYVVSALVGCSESPNSTEISVTPIVPVPRTQKLGSRHMCGCSSALDPSWLALGALLAALLLLAVKRYS